jgi:hypothetical protein
MLEVREIGTRGEICTHTGGALDAVPLLLGYAGDGNRTGSCTRIPVWRAQSPKLLDDAVV